MYYFNELMAMQLLKDAYRVGASIEEMKEMACYIRNWTQFKEQITEIIDSYESLEDTQDV